MTRPPGAATRGRPPSTSREQVAHVALELFVQRGFDETTVDDVAAALGVGRRTVFRYFPSKNDMVWGDFDSVLDRLRADLAALGDDVGVMEAISRAAVSSNHYEPEQLPELRIRLRLITTVPALQAHSMLRYAAWRAVIADYVAQRLQLPAAALLPQAIAHAALGVSIAAFSCWVHDEDQDLEESILRAYTQLASGWPATAMKTG